MWEALSAYCGVLDAIGRAYTDINRNGKKASGGTRLIPEYFMTHFLDLAPPDTGN